MATAYSFILVLPLLLLAATLEHSREEENGDRNMNETEVCSRPKLHKSIRRYNRTRNWLRLQRDLDGILDHDSKVYNQLQAMEFWEMYRIGHRGYIQLASLLLCGGLAVDTSDRDGDTMLHGAATGGQLQLARLLLDRGANVNARGIGKTTPLIRAAKNGHLEVVKLLVEAGGNITVTEFNGRTAIDRARSRGMTEVVHYLEQLLSH